MVTIANARKIILSLPGTEEYDHVGRPAFRANGRTFITFWEADERLMIILSQIDQSVFCAFDATVVYPVPNKWGSHHGCTFFELKTVYPDMLLDAITTSYQTMMAKKPNSKSPKKK